MAPLRDQFVSEPVRPVAGTFDAAGMAHGEPGLPARFVWRGVEHAVAETLSRWKTSDRRQGERYLRRHWFKVRTADGTVMTLYCERQPKPMKRARSRWWVYTVEERDT